MKTKICTKCNKEKELTGFTKDKYGKFGRYSICKYCINIPTPKMLKDKQLFKQGLKECTKCHKQKSFLEFHKHKLGKFELSSTCKECDAIKSKQYRIDNKEYFLKYQKEYSKKYRKQNKENISRDFIEKRKTDINFKLKDNLRRRLNNALKGNTKSKRTLKLLGCTIEQLKIHLQSQFTEGMTWDNHGKGYANWNIDHKLPCASFDFSKKSEQLKCFNYKNLQPLWAIDNLRKSDKILN